MDLCIKTAVDNDEETFVYTDDVAIFMENREYLSKAILR